METEKLVGTSAEFNMVVESDEVVIAQQLQDANKKALALRPSCLNSHSQAPVFVRIQELQETFEKQLKSSSDASMRKLRDLCEHQKADYVNLYEQERARLMKILK